MRILLQILSVTMCLFLVTGCSNNYSQTNIAPTEVSQSSAAKNKTANSISSAYYMLESHPKFLDSKSCAQAWVDSSKPYIEFGDIYNDSTKINVSCGVDWQSDFIIDICVYLHKFYINDYSKVINIAKEFLPAEKISQYYLLKETYTLADESTPEMIEHYFAVWELSEQGLELYKAQDFSGTYQIVLQIDCDDNEYNLWLHDEVPNWATRVEFNGFIKSDWNIQL